MDDTIRKIIKAEIGRLQDDAYRYRHLGQSPSDVAYADVLDAKVSTLERKIGQ